MRTFGRKGPILSTNDPNDVATAAAVHRRLTRALADLGIVPQPIGPRVQNWTTLVDGVITFGALSITTAARLVNVLEDIAAGRDASPNDRSDNEQDNEPDSVVDFAATFEPVASPFEAGSGPSRFHPRVAN